MKREWKTDDYAVRVVPDSRQQAWVEYEEAGRILALQAEFTTQTHLSVWIPNEVYLPPDYHDQLPENRIALIQQRIAIALDSLGYGHDFTRLGWTSV